MIPSYKKILYASDLEKGSREAFKAALSLRDQYQGDITYVHIINLHRSSVGIRDYIDEDALSKLHNLIVDDIRSDISSRLDKFVLDEQMISPGFELGPINVRIEEGEPWTKIIEISDDINADVIIMGTRTHSAADQMLLGSTANKVIHHSTPPVFVVPIN